MPGDLLAISVGNTRTHVGVFRADALAQERRVPNDRRDELNAALAELYGHLSEAVEPGVYLASVNDAVAGRLEAAVRDRLGVDVRRVERDVAIPIGRQTDVESITGEDRLLNAAAAYDTAKEAVIIVDAGTAVTVDFVDGAGTLHGGAILPGTRLMLDALHRETAQLPAIEFARPVEAIGHSTTEAMRTGVYHAIRGGVRDLIERFAEHYQAWPRAIATGGDAEILFAGYDLIEAIVPELTLRGMAVAHRYATTQTE